MRERKKKKSEEGKYENLEKQKKKAQKIKKMSYKEV